MKPDPAAIQQLLQDLREIQDFAYDYHDEREDELEAEWMAWIREDDAARSRSEERYQVGCDRDARAMMYDLDD